MRRIVAQGARSSALGMALILMVAAVSFATGTVRAAGPTHAWTSTQDFDNGTKASVPRYHFVDNVGIRGLNDAGGPSALYRNGRTYVTYQSADGANNNDPYITYYDHANGTWATPADVGNNLLVGDGHGSPCLGMNSTGILHVFFGAHASALQHRVSVNPEDISAWSSKADLTGQVTYCHVVTRATSMWVLYRLGSAVTTDTIRYRKSTDDGATFGAEQTILDAGVSNGYYLGWNTELWADRIYSTAKWNRATALVCCYNVYAFYLNTTDGHVYSVGGTDMGTTATLAELNASALVETTYPSSLSGTATIHTDALGAAYLIYTTNKTGSWKFNFTRWTGASWSAIQTVRSAGGSSDPPDFIVRSAATVDAFILAPGDTSGSGAMDKGGDVERWEWSGGAWSLRETILTESVIGVEERFGSSPHLHPRTLDLPQVPLGFQEDLSLVFNEFIDNNNDYENLRIYGWGNDGFVPNSGAAQGGSSVETATDDATVTAGGFRLVGGQGDTFSTPDSDGDNRKWNPGKFTSSAVQTINRLDIEGGRYVINTTTTGVYWAAGAVSAYTYTTPDISVNTNRIYETGAGSNWASLAIYNEREVDCIGDGVSGGAPGTIDGPFIRLVNANSVQTYKCQDGVATVVGSATAIGATNQICFRIENVTNQWKTYYSVSATCASWTLDETFSFTVPGRMYAVLNSVANGAGTVNYTYDDFTLRSGAMGVLGFERSGSWASPLIAFDGGNVPSTVTVSHTGASAAAYVSAIELLDASGNVLRSDPSDHPSGTSATYTVPYSSALKQAWKVRVLLEGDGSASPTVTQVVVQTTPIPFGADLRDIVTGLVYILGALTALVIVISVVEVAFVGGILKHIRGWHGFGKGLSPGEFFGRRGRK